MSKLESLKGEQIHSRSIRIETFAVDDERVIVEGVLEDMRSNVMYTISGTRREPGRVHGMVARLLVGEMPAKILDVEVEMPKVPLDECEQTADSVKKLVGMPVVYGFSKAVKERLGGTEGCTHLTSLVLTMGSAVVQGMAAHRGRSPAPPAARKIMLQYVKNTCRIWREDGPVFQKVIEETKEAEG